jgi:hypothetical protein
LDELGLGAYLVIASDSEAIQSGLRGKLDQLRLCTHLVVASDSEAIQSGLRGSWISSGFASTSSLRATAKQSRAACEEAGLLRR